MQANKEDHWREHAEDFDCVVEDGCPYLGTHSCDICMSRTCNEHKVTMICWMQANRILEYMMCKTCLNRVSRFIVQEAQKEAKEAKERQYAIRPWTKEGAD
jgi:hypothetical protein